MKQSKTLRRSLLCGLGVLSLAAVGCGGGGGGTLVSPATLTINGGATASFGRTSKSVSKALGQINTVGVTINIYSLDGTLLDSLLGQTLPADVVLNDATLNAMTTGSAVFKVSDGTNEYKTIVKVDSTQIGSGPVQAVGGGDLAELVGPGSTAVTALVALEMESTLGTPIVLGEVNSPETQAAVKNLVAQDKPAVDPASLANSLKSSVNTAGSMVKAIVDAIRTQTGTASPASFLRKPPAAAKAIISQGRRFSKANARLSGAAKSTVAGSSLAAQLTKKLAALALSTTANADSASSGANMIANVVSMADKTTGTAKTSLAAQLTNLVADNVPITGAAAKAATDILPVLVDNAAALEEAGASADVAGLIGAVMQDNTIATNSGVSGVFDSFLQVVKDPTAFAGEAIKTASDTPAGASRVVKQVAATSQVLGGALDFSAAVKEVAKAAGSGLVLELAKVIKDLPASTTAALFNGDTTAGVDSFVGALADTLTGDALADVAASATDIGLSANVIADKAKISGPTSAKSGSTFVLYNNSVATGDATSYTYSWTVTPAVAGTVATDASVSFTASAASGYSVKLEQAKGSVITTATHSVSVAAKLLPVVFLATDTLNIAQSKSGAVNVVVYDPEGRTLTAEATVVGTGLTFGSLTGAGGLLTVSAASDALAKAYTVNIAVKEGSITLFTKQLTVNVKALANTKVFLTGVMDKQVGDSITIKAVSVQEKAVTAGLLEIIITNSNATTPSATTVLVVGNTNVSATVTSLATGTYTVTVNAKDGNTVLGTFSSAFNVKAVGAPTFSKLDVAGTSVLEFPNVQLVGAALTASVVIDAAAAVTGTTATVTYALQDGTATAVTLSGVTSETVTVGAGITKSYTLIATANGKVVKKAFKVTYTQTKKLVVSSVAMAGNVPNVTNGNLANSVVGTNYVMNASNIQNLTLNTSDTMYLDIMVDTSNTTALAGPGYNFEVSLTDAANSRSATLKVVNATLAGDSTNGFDVTTAASLDFAGTKSNGSNATISVPVQTVITNFTPLFSAVSGGMRIDLIALRNSMEQILTGNSFASSLRTLNGANLTVTIKMSGANFSMTNVAGNGFNTFQAINVKVN